MKLKHILHVVMYTIIAQVFYYVIIL